MTRARRPALAAIVLCVGTACEGETASDGARVDEVVPAEQLPEGTFTFTPDPEATAESERTRRRLDLDQLDQSFRVVSGFSWTRRTGGRDVDRLQELADTLGKPDFIDVVDEDLSPSPMFLKFLDDGARAVCDRWLDADASRAPSERTFFALTEPNTTYSADPAAARANIQALMLRAHGRWTELDDPVLDRWLSVLQAAEQNELPTRAGWRAVCVALFTHPDFYLY